MTDPGDQAVPGQDSESELPPSAVPAGWYRTPAGKQRYWDGTTWTALPWDESHETRSSTVPAQAPNDAGNKALAARSWRLGLIIGCAAIVVALVAVIVVLAIPRSANATACGDYATGYNRFADAITSASKNGSDRSLVLAAESNMESLMTKAANEAHGKVASAMIDSTSLAPDLDKSSDDGTAFFLSTSEVKAACEADGAGITLDPVK